MTWVKHAQHRNTDWSLWADDNGRFGTDAVMRAILLDIRAELQALNAVFKCWNFQRIPLELDLIERNTNRQTQRRLAEQRKRAKARKVTR